MTAEVLVMNKYGVALAADRIGALRGSASARKGGAGRPGYGLLRRFAPRNDVQAEVNVVSKRTSHGIFRL